MLLLIPGVVMMSDRVTDDVRAVKKLAGRAALPTLVVTRRTDEGLMISGEIELFVVSVRTDRVRLGIHAPVHIQVHRRELYEALRNGSAQPDLFPLGDAAARTTPRPSGKPPRLVLTRRRHESIMIGDEVEVIVVELHEEEVRLAVRHPPYLEVVCKEAYEARQSGNTPFAP